MLMGKDLTSEDFKNFMRDVQQWIDNGHPQDNIWGFCNHDSLCFLVNKWYKNKGFSIGSGRALGLRSDLSIALCCSFGNDSTPFNEKEGKPRYAQEMSDGTHYSNPARLEWIKTVVDSFEGK